jgi:hypothetical protein
VLDGSPFFMQNSSQQTGITAQIPLPVKGRRHGVKGPIFKALGTFLAVDNGGAISARLRDREEYADSYPKTEYYSREIEYRGHPARSLR